MSDIEKIHGITPDLTKENVDRLLALFPDVATEITDPKTGRTERAVDFDALKERLGDVAEGNRERYQFTWPGKREAKRLAREPIAKTLRPVKERSKDWDTTRNLYIEGDNLDALKLLRENYAGKVKLIYIDPPYNTGHDFIYKDNFGKTIAADKSESGDYNDEGGQLVANPESNGRFHSDWCSMIYPRLMLARDLLTRDGAIFISIDDNEESDLQNLCNEIFGERNFVAKLYVKVNPRGRNLDMFVARTCEPVLCYANNYAQPTTILPVEKDERMMSEYSLSDSYGAFRPIGLRNRNQNFNPVTRPTLYYPLYVNDKGNVSLTPDKEYRFEVFPDAPDGTKTCWTWSKQKVQQEGKLLYAEKARSGEWRIFRKDYADKDGKGATTLVKSLWDANDVNNDQGKASIKDLFGSNIMDFPKSPYLLKRIVEIGSLEESTVLDFFSGSATTAEAVMMKNAEDNGRRKFIMVQLPEITDPKSATAKAGYSTICEIGEERIRRAGEKIKSEIEAENAQLTLDGTPKKVPDIGFRVLRVDDSNYEDRRKLVDEYSQKDIDDDVDITKMDRSDLDLLFEALPKFQLPYSSKIDVLSGGEFDGHTVYSVNNGKLLACFEDSIPESLVRTMAAFRPRPSYVLVSENGFLNSAARTNFTEIFKQSADEKTGSTQIRII